MLKTALGKILNINRIDGGLNKKASVFDIADNEAVGLVNFVFTEYGILKKRKGFVKHNDIEITGADGIYGLYRFYKKNGDKYEVATTKDKIYKYNDSDKQNRKYDELTCDETLTSNQRFHFIMMNDKLFMTNGANKPLKWAGGSAHVKLMGIVSPANSAIATDSGSTGNLNGTYYWKITYYNSTDMTESRACTAFTTTVITNHSVNITNIPRSTDPQVDKIKIYRTPDSNTIYYYVDEINNPASGTGSYTDNSSDATIQANVQFDATNNYPPPIAAKYIAMMKNRIFLYSNSDYPTRLWWSETDKPEYFPANNYIDVPADAHGQIGTGILAWGDYLYIFNENGVSVLTDPADPSSSYLKEVSNTIGCISPESLKTGQFQRPIKRGDYLITQGIVLNTRFGIMGFDGQTFWPLSERIEPILDDIYEDNIKQAVGFFNNNKYHLAYTNKKGSIINGGQVIYKQLSTDVGGESKYAILNSDHSANNYQGSYDAKIDLSHTSMSNGDITVKIYVDWMENSTKADYLYSQSVAYEIFFSYDNGSTWKSKGTFEKNTNFRNLKKSATLFYFTHGFHDSSVTNVRVDLFYGKAWYSGLSLGRGGGDEHDFTNKINIESVEYSYDYSYAITGYSVKNDKIVYYDSLHNAWSEFWGINANLFYAFNGAGDNREEFFGSSKDGYVYQMNVGSDDDGSDIFCLFESKYYDMKDRSRKKRFNNFSISTNIYPATLYIDIFVDGVQIKRTPLNMALKENNISYYGDKYYGEAVMDGNIDLIHYPFSLPSNALGKFINIQLWSTSKENLAIKDFSVRFIEREGMR